MDDRMLHAGGTELLERLKSGGLLKITASRIPDLVAHLEMEAASTGLCAPVFVALALTRLQALHEEHDQYGGVGRSFLAEVDKMLIERLRSLHPWTQAGGLPAKLFRDDLVLRVADYKL